MNTVTLFRLAASVFALSLVTVTAHASPQAQSSRWDLRFGDRGPNGTVDEVAVFDDGHGPRAFFEDAGYFTYGPLTTLTAWDAHAQEEELFYVNHSRTFFGEPATVDALLVYDGAAGKVLLAGGVFESIGGVSADGLAVFDGENWSAWPGGPPPGGGCVTHLVANGAELFAAAIDSSLFPAVVVVSRWTGAAWEQLGPGWSSFRTIEYSTVGGAGAIYASTNQDVWRFENGAWVALPTPPSSPDVMTHYDGDVPLLVAADNWDVSPTVNAWDGTAWMPLGSQAPDGVDDFAVRHRDGRDLLFACGRFTSAGGQAAQHVAYWDGTSWNALVKGVHGRARSIAVDVTARDVFVAGEFLTAGNANAAQVARWDGEGWNGFGNGQGLAPKPTTTLAAGTAWEVDVLDVGRGPELFVGGDFRYAGSSPKPGVAVWRKNRWHALGEGFDGRVFELATFDDGAGPVLYAGGELDPVASTYLSRFDGVSWQPVLGFDGIVSAFATIHDNSGTSLVVAGGFTIAGGVPADGLARFDGTTWSAFGNAPITGDIADLVVHDDGTGAALYAAGSITSIGGVAVNGVARWNGAAWSPVGAGFEVDSLALVITLEIVDVPALGGSRLVAGGSFTNGANGEELGLIASWDGVAWTQVGPGLAVPGDPFPRVYDIDVYDDGFGRELVACGFFSTTQSSSLDYAARFDGSTWQTFDGLSTNFAVRLASFERALWIGGSHMTVDGEPSLGIARRLGPESHRSGRKHGGATPLSPRRRLR